MDPIVEQKLSTFFGHYPLVRFQRGQAVTEAEKAFPDVFWVTKGMVRMYHVADDGNELTLHLFRHPSFFPIANILSHEHKVYYFQAMNAVSAHKAPATDVVRFLKDNPDVLFNLSERFSKALMDLLHHIEQISSHDAFVRIGNLLLYLVEHFGVNNEGALYIDMHLTHDDIASWTGIARETVIHQLEKLARLGVISMSQGTLIVHNTDYLLQFTD